MTPTPTNRSAFLARMVALGGPPSEDEGARAATTTLEALARCLTRAERARLAADLPSELATALHPEEDDPERPSFDDAPTLSTNAIYAAVAHDLGLPMGRAVETAQIVCRVVAETVDERARAVVVDHPDHDVARLFSLPDDGASKPSYRPRRAHSLAEGAPGSRRPVSETNPRGAHQGSIAAWDGARAGRTLGGYRGHDGETLATGTPGSSHKLSDNH